MNWKFLISISLIFITENCLSQKPRINPGVVETKAINTAIQDFLKTKKFLKKDSVFDVDVFKISDDLVGVSIFGVDNRLIPSNKVRIGTHQPGFPTKYFEQSGKLFYWYDSTYDVTSKLIAALSRFNQIDSINVNGFVGLPIQKTDDSKKGAQYYFCNCDLTKYRRVYTSIAMGWYSPPNVHCDCGMK